MDIAEPYLLFLANAGNRAEAKTAAGIAYWRPERCIGQWRLSRDTVDLGLPDLSPADAAARGARTLIIGIAPLGGALPATWLAPIEEALRAGLDIAGGLHAKLNEIAPLRRLAATLGRQLHDVRTPRQAYPVAVFRKRSGNRLLTVGTDCALGKKFAALAIARCMRDRGIAATFRATGQTGILIAGEGVPIDAVPADFVAGAAEWLTPDAADDHWDVIEGQGSLHHPSYAGVSLGLLHGVQPDAIVICHDPSRRFNGDFLDLPLPSLSECADLALRHARLVNPRARVTGVSLNTGALSEGEAAAALAAAAGELGVPAADPVRHGAGALVDALAC